MNGAWQRWCDVTAPAERWLGRRVPSTLIALVAVSLLVLTTLPFGLWYGYGPARFEALELGVVPPAATEAPTELSSAEAVASGSQGPRSDRLAPGVPLDLGPNVRVTLLFSTGSRNLTGADAAALRINDAEDRGSDGLTDVLMLVVADPDSGQVALFSIPRDLYLNSRSTRINGTWARHGTQTLVDDVANVIGMPIHHVIQVNFTAFGELVDRLGGVAIQTDRALADYASTLYVPGPGCWRFAGADALAYVRSRKTLTLSSSGRWVTDRSASDFGRIDRQQQLMRAAFNQLRGPGLVTRVPDLLQVARGGLVVDQGLGLTQVRGLANAFAGVSAGSFEGFTVPTFGRRINGAEVLIPDQDKAVPMMTRLRSWPPETGTAADTAPTTTPAAGFAPGQPLAAAAPEACSLSSSSRLPNANEALARIHRGGSVPAAATADDDRPLTSEPATSSPEPTSTPSGTETAEPSPSPTTTPTETTTPSPSPSPSPSPTPSPSGMPMPLPIPTPTGPRPI